MKIRKKEKIVRKKKKEIKIEGKASYWFETGSEGLEWVVLENFTKGGKLGSASLHRIEEGDHLTIFNEDDSIAFEGEVVCDRKTGQVWRDKKYKVKQQVAFNYWIHWTQKGWKPNDWAKLFLECMNRDKLLRAILVKRFIK